MQWRALLMTKSWWPVWAPIPNSASILLIVLGFLNCSALPYDHIVLWAWRALTKTTQMILKVIKMSSDAAVCLSTAEFMSLTMQWLFFFLCTLCELWATTLERTDAGCLLNKAKREEEKEETLDHTALGQFGQRSTLLLMLGFVTLMLDAVQWHMEWRSPAVLGMCTLP